MRLNGLKPKHISLGWWASIQMIVGMVGHRFNVRFNRGPCVLLNGWPPLKCVVEWCDTLQMYVTMVGQTNNLVLNSGPP